MLDEPGGDTGLMRSGSFEQTHPVRKRQARPKSNSGLGQKVTCYWQTRPVFTRNKLIPLVLILSAAVSLLLFPRPEIAVKAHTNFSTAEIALEDHWIKGAAPILAAHFDSVRIVNVNKEVEESFVFDVALGQIYDIDADYTLPPIDVRAKNLSAVLAANSKERSEIFCNNKDLKYCELELVWDQSAPTDALFIALRVEDALYALVEAGLAKSLGVSIDE